MEPCMKVQGSFFYFPIAVKCIIMIRKEFRYNSNKEAYDGIYTSACTYRI